jgi:uroporphyrinogen decarboxylase
MLGNQKITLQGNLDPLVLLGDQKIIRKKIAELFNELVLTKTIGNDFTALDGYIFNLGHGISQFTPPENVACLIDAVRTESARHR